MLRETTAGGHVAYAAQRPKTCAYSGSAVGLKARSHPSGTFPGKDLVGDNAAGPLVRWTFCCSRSPLRVRSTETTTARSSLATLGPFTAQNAAAVTQLTTSAAAVALRSKENTRHMCLSPTALTPRLRRVRGARVCERDHADRMGVAAAFAAVAEAGALVVRPGLGAAGVAALGCARDRWSAGDGAGTNPTMAPAQAAATTMTSTVLSISVPPTTGCRVRWNVQRRVDARLGVIDASVSNDCATL
jgi:hypothetical protein